jgi:Transposase DDE domain
MNDTLIVTIFVTIDEVMTLLGHRSHPQAGASDSEVLTVAVVAACQCQNHHERALCMMRALHYLSGDLSVSRFKRRVHALADWLPLLLDLLGEVLAKGEAFVIDSMPLPVCHRARAGRCRKVRGAVYCGYCAAKEEKIFGWRLHLIVTPTGVPVSFEVLPASYHDLTPVHELIERIPGGAWVYADKGYNSGDDEAMIEGETGVRLVPIRKANMAPNSWEERIGLREHRKQIEVVNSQLAAWGIQRLHARTNAGFMLKVWASLVALLCVNAR